VAGVLLGACAVQPARPGTSAPPLGADEPSPAATSPAPSGPTRPFRPTPTPAPTFATHVVRRGDTLIDLARRFGTTTESLAYWNRARYPSLDPDSASFQPDRIEVGWELAYLAGQVVDPENLPPASEPPGASPGPGASSGPFPTLPADGSAALVERGPAGLAGVALTFDYAGGEGSGLEAPAAIVQWLEAEGVPATVFVAGSAAADASAGPVLGRLAAAREVRAGLLADAADATGLAGALGAADEALAGQLGASTVPFLRPADGQAVPAALRAAGRAGWTWAISWDVDPGDGVAPEAGGPIALDIVARVVSRASGGSIVRLQLGGAHTLEALPGILDGLAAKGLAVVPLEAVLGLDGTP
jgi:hypothetical protein